jgi:hypothetical protein
MKNKFKKGDLIISRWNNRHVNCPQTDFAIFDRYIGKDSFDYLKFFRIEQVDKKHSTAIDLSNDTHYPIELKEHRHSLNWRKMTNKEIIKYLPFILTEL